MRYNPLIATLTIALGALALVGALIWQVVHGHDVDPLLAGLAGTLFGAFLNAPNGATKVQVAQPRNQPVPVDDAGHGSLDLVVGVLLVVILVVVLLRLL